MAVLVLMSESMPMFRSMSGFCFRLRLVLWLCLMLALMRALVVRHGPGSRGVFFKGCLGVRGGHRRVKVTHGVPTRRGPVQLTPWVGLHGGALEHWALEHGPLDHGALEYGAFVRRALELRSLKRLALVRRAVEGGHHADRVVISRLHAAVAGEAGTATPLELRHRLVSHFEDGFVHQTIPDVVEYHQ